MTPGYQSIYGGGVYSVREKTYGPNGKTTYRTITVTPGYQSIYGGNVVVEEREQ